MEKHPLHFENIEVVAGVPKTAVPPEEFFAGKGQSVAAGPTVYLIMLEQ